VDLINVGFGNFVSAHHLITIVSPDSAPIKRIINEARDRGVLIDATHGRRTRAAVIMTALTLSCPPSSPKRLPVAWETRTKWSEVNNAKYVAA